MVSTVTGMRLSLFLSYVSLGKKAYKDDTLEKELASKKVIFVP